MATIHRFEDLQVWQEASVLVESIYAATKQPGFVRDFPLRDQIRRAAISTMSNIAEGFERGSKKEFIQFLHIAKGSNGEVRSQLHVAKSQGYISELQFGALKVAAETLSRRLSAFIRYLDSVPFKARTKPR